MSDSAAPDEEKSAREYVTPDEFKVLMADAQQGRMLPVEVEPVEASRTDPHAFAAGIQSGAAIERLGAAARITRAGLLDDVVTAARALKAAESTYREAQQAYGEAVKRLSEEAVK